MKPVLRCVIASALYLVIKAADDLLPLPKIEITLSFDLVNYDYITEDMTPPVGALYCASMDGNGNINVVVAKNILYTPNHNFLGWPLPT